MGVILWNYKRIMYFLLTLLGNSMNKIFYYLLLLSTLFVVAGAQSQTLHWQQLNGPNGGTILCFAVSGSALFAGAYYNGVYRSTNNGNTWMHVNNGLTNGHV